jgi:glycosyltransferase involved in cell wall biosynthesis
MYLSGQASNLMCPWCMISTSSSVTRPVKQWGIIPNMRVGINAHLLAFTENYRQAGLSRYIYELLVRLPAIERGTQFIAFVGNGRIPKGFLKSGPPNLTIARSRLPTARAPVRIAWEQVKLPFAARREKLDLLHCPVNVRPIWSPCPSIVTVHDLVFLRYPENFRPGRRRYLRAMTTWSARRATHVIAVSEATRRDVIDLLRVKPERVSTVHNGVGEQFKRLSDEAKERFARDKEIAGRVILYVGTLEPRKNLVTLLQSFSSFAEEPGFEDVTLAIGGSKGWYYEEIFAEAERLELAKRGRVRFLGRVPDQELPLWYNIATIFVYPSVYEGFGLPALEAMACGTPVITSNTSAFPEVVGEAGILLDPHDPHAWTQAMKRLLEDKRAAQELGSRGIAQARNFSWERAARETAAVYRRVLSGES